MGKISSFLWGAAIATGVMYFMDPQNGNRRKAMIRDQVYRMRSRGDEAIDSAVNDLRNRARGVLAEGIAMVSPKEGVPDYVLEERIRSRIGFFSRHPGALQVSVQDGTATLSGDMLAAEADSILSGVRKVRGIRQVENRARQHQTDDGIPQLRGAGGLRGEGGQVWSPSTRLLAGAGAGYLLIYGMFRGGLTGMLARLGGLYLGTRALTNRNFSQLAGRSADDGLIRVRKTIEINAPLEEVYDLWSNFENFPRFMHNIESIHNMGDGSSHWVVKGPAGAKVEFDAFTTQMVPLEVVAWETAPGSMVRHHGQVRFHKSERGTQVNVIMAYTPPAGVAGHAVATLFGKDPKSEMDSDLARMKALLETGRTPAAAAHKTFTREELWHGASVPVTGSLQEERKARREEDEFGQSRDIEPMETYDDEPRDAGDLANDDV